MSKLIRLPLVLAAASLLALAGCGGDDDRTETESEAAATAAETGGFEIVGSWQGQLSQQGLEPFRVTAEVRDLNDPAANTVAYTGIDCGGNWTYLGEGDDGQTLRFREVIDRGVGGDCKGVGIVTLEPISDDALSYEFRGGGVVSEGELRRTTG